MTVIMHIDGVKVYEAVLGDTAEYPDRNEKFRLYDAKFVDGEVVYTDNTDYYAVFYSYNAYVKSGTTANFITADMYATCGGGFVVDVEEADNPVVSDFTQDGVTIKDAKQYFVVVNDTNN